MSSVFNFLNNFPENLIINTSVFWESLIKYINVNYFDSLETFKITLLTYFMLPIKRFFLGVPWPWFIFVLTVIGWHFGRIKLAILCFRLQDLELLNLRGYLLQWIYPYHLDQEYQQRNLLMAWVV